MNIRKWIALLLSLCLLVTALPMTACAYEPLSYSDNLVEFIKANEGFTKFAAWDYSQWSIGYGSGCNPADYPDGITEEQADALLRAYLVRFVDVANDFCRRHGMQPTQGQFDSIVSITYGLGSGWMDTSEYKLPRLMINGCTELQLLNVLGDWVNASGVPLDGLIFRRMREVYMYFHESYQMTGKIWEDVPYACLKFNPNGGVSESPRLYTFRGQPFGLDESLPNCTRSGYRFLGWYDKNGNRITDDTIAWYELATAEAYWEPDYIAPAPADLFTDVYRADWFFEAVKAASERGIFSGYPDGSFRPNASMTRAMFAQVLYRIAGQPKLPAELPFADVAPSDWFHDAVCWAYASGIVNGVSETSFAPDRSITREQMATMLYKYSVHMDSAEESDFGSLDGFTDAGSVSGYAETPLRWAVGTGLINGMGDGRLSPATFATRAQASAILIRLTGMIRKGIA